MKKLLLLISALLFTFYYSKAQIVLQQDFETPPYSNFYAFPDSTSIYWTTSTTLFANGTKSINGKKPLGTGQSAYRSIKFFTGGKAKVYLKFNHICKLNSGNNARIMYRKNGTVGTLTFIDKTTNTYFSPPTDGSLGYNINKYFNETSYGTTWQQGVPGAVPNNSWWKPEIFDISEYVGNTNDTVEIQFRIEKFDNTTVAGWFLDDIEVIAADNEMFAPVIEQLPVVWRDTVEGFGHWTVNAKVKDKYSNSPANSSNVDTVKLYYSTLYQGNTNNYVIDMTNYGTGDSLFRANIPVQPYGTKITYHICARDSFANTTCTPDTFFVNRRPDNAVVVSRDTAVLSTQPNPFFQTNSQTKTQFIIKATELQALGLQPGNLEAISFYITIPSTATNTGTGSPHGNFFKGFTIKIGTTGLDQTSATGFSTGLTQVFSAPGGLSTATHSTGWNKFAFSNLFNWDGISNLIIETCYNNFAAVGGTDFSTNATIWQMNTLPAYNASVYAYTQNAVPNLCDDGTSNIGVSSKRPIVKIFYNRTNLATDAKMEQIIEPLSTHSANFTPIKVKIKNFGQNHLTTANISWSDNGVLQGTYNWVGLLYQDMDSVITLRLNHNLIPPGNHQIKAWIAQPNGGVDLNRNNDTLSVDLYVCGGTLAGGTYTVGGTSPDFANLKDVERKLNQCGISGPVLFNIRPGNYSSNIELRTISGASPTNTITFKSENNNANSVVITNPTHLNGTILLDSTDFIRFEHLTLKSQDPQKANVVLLRGNNQDIIFENNIFEGLDTNTTASQYDLVYSSKAITHKDSSIVFRKNTFKYGSSGLTFIATSTKPSNYFIIDSNTFISQSYRGITLNYVNGLSLHANSFSQKLNSQIDYSGLYFTFCKWIGNISNNKVVSENMLNGLYLANCSGKQNTKMNIQNNFVGSKVTLANGSGIFLNTCDSVNVFHNSINLNGSQTTSKAININAGKIYDVRNNIFNNYANGYAYYVGTVPVAPYTSDYNDLYTTGTNLGFFASNNRTTLAAWRTATTRDANSVNVNPYFSAYNSYQIIELDLDGKAQYISTVANDIDGNLRSTTTPDIGATEFTSPTTNMAINEILEPLLASSYCGGNNLPIKIKIRNAGVNVINFSTESILYTMQITGPTNQQYTFNLNTDTLASGASRDIIISNALNFSLQGIYTIKIFSTLATDFVRYNDTITTTLDIRKIQNFPLVMDFSNQTDPAWKITQLAGTNNWNFVNGGLTSPTLPQDFGTGIIMQTKLSGAKSRIQTPTMDFTTLDQPYLEFWMSQDNAGSTFLNEGITVRISTDGGQTWNNDTLFVRRYNASYTTPGWKIVGKLLTPYANSNCVIVALDVNSQGGNNIGVDKFVIRNLKNNDLRTNVIYTNGKLPVIYGVPHNVNATIENYGSQKQYNKSINLSMTGTNTINQSIIIDSIAPFEIKNINFTISPTISGVNNITVSTPNDDENINNSQSYRMETTPNYFAYNDTSIYNIKAVENGNGLLLAKYKINGYRTIKGVRAYISGSSSVGKEIYGVVLNHNGVVLDSSARRTISAADTNTWVTFSFPKWHITVVTDTTFYVGIAQVGTGYTPLGSQFEYPMRSNSFYTATNFFGAGLTQTRLKGRLMLEANIEAMPAFQPLLINAFSPVTGCGIHNDSVKVTIRNNGIQTIPANTISAWYSANGGPAITPQLVNVAIPSNTQIQWTFPVTGNFVSSINDINYDLKIWINHPNDQVNVDDTIRSFRLTSKQIPPTPTVLNQNPFNVSYFQMVEMAANIPAPYQGNLNWYATQTSTPPFFIGTDHSIDTIRTADTCFYLSTLKIDGFVNVFGTGTISNSEMPFRGSRDYGWTSMLYKTNEVTNFGTIDTLWFELNSAGAGYTLTNQKVFISLVNDQTIASADLIDTTIMTKVYDGSIVVNSTTWLVVPLITPINFDGSKNLLIHWRNYDGSQTTTGSPTFKTTIMNDTLAVYNSQNINFPSFSGTKTKNRPNMKFGFKKTGCESPRLPLCVHVINMPVQDIQPTNITHPLSSCNLRNENIKVIVKNHLNKVVPAGSKIYYKINNLPPVLDTIDVTIPSRGSIQFTFSQPFDFAASLTNLDFDIKVWTSIPEDTYKTNDTVKNSIVSGFTAIPYTPTTINIPYGTTYNFNSTNLMYIFPTQTSTTPITISTDYTTPYLYQTTNYWVLSRAASSVTIRDTIGKDLEISKKLPTLDTATYGWSAMIYKKDELTSIYIDTIGFQNLNDSIYTLQNQKIYFGYTDLNKFIYTTAKPDPQNLTLVYEGPITWDSDWNKIILQNKFSYTGDKNLLIYWENANGGYVDYKAPKIKSTEYTDTLCVYSSSLISVSHSYTEPKIKTQIRPNLFINGKILSCPTDTIKVTINTTGAPALDAGVIRYVSPLGGVGYLTNNERIKVVVKNFGTQAISNFPIKYLLNNQVKTETITSTINSHDTLVYTFTTVENLINNYENLPVKVWTELTGDNFHQNDTINYTILQPNYCLSYALNGPTHEDIGFVHFGGISNGYLKQMYSNPLATQPYTNFTQIPKPGYLVKGGNYPIYITQFTSGSQTHQGKVKIYIDFNRDGTYGAGEVFGPYNSTTSSGLNLRFDQMSASGQISIPTSAQTGPTRMRVVLDQATTGNFAPSCGTYNYGETEDYIVFINPKSNIDASLTNYIGNSSAAPMSQINKQDAIQTLKVSLQNTGNTAMTNATIRWKHNNGATQVINWTGNLAPSAAIPVTIGDIILTPIDNEVIAWVDMANDTIKKNDTITYKIFGQPKKDIGLVSFLNPTSLSCPNSNEDIKVRISNLGYDTIKFNETPITLYSNVLITDINSYNKVIGTGQLLPGQSMDVNIAQANLSTGGYYQFKLFVTFSQDGNIENDTLNSDTIFLPEPYDLTYNEDFETFTLGTSLFSNYWSQQTFSPTNKKYKWCANKGQTKSGSSSGPPADHTTGTPEVGKYMYAYGVDGAENDQVHLVSNCLKTAGVSGQFNEISFWYYMFNPGTNATLYVDYGTGNNWTTLDSIKGQQQLTQNVNWLKKTTSYAADNKNWRLRFRAKRGSTKGDIALDDINMIKLAPDVGVNAIVAPGAYPNDSCQIWRWDSVSVKIKNYNRLPIDSVLVAYSINGNEIVTELYNGIIPADAEVTYKFNTKFQVPNNVVNNICAYTKRTIDVDPTNNSYCRNFFSWSDPNDTTTNILESTSIDGFVLYQNIPNPANNFTTINYITPQADNVNLVIFDMIGNIIEKHTFKSIDGLNTYKLNTSNINPGLYNYSLEYKGKRLHKKMIILK